MITKDDSVKFNWKVTGEPTLLFYQEDAGDDLNPGAQLLSYKLVARKGQKEDFLMQILTLLPDTSSHVIKLKTIRNGNALFALDTLQTQKWGTYFKVDQVQSFTDQPIVVVHGGRTAGLEAKGQVSGAFKGIPNSGPWEIRSFLTEAEMKDSTKIPGHLIIQARVIHQKN
jgi:hypothetical protein